MQPSEPSLQARRSRLGTVRRWCFVGSLLAALTGAVFAFPRTEIIETHTTLQGGKKVDVQLTLQSAWRWLTPDRITGLRVAFDGAASPVSPDAYTGVGRVDSSVPPVVPEIRGFPEIVIRGSQSGPMKEVRFRFQNYSFSERLVQVGCLWETKFYAMPLPTPAVASVRLQNPRPGVFTFGPESIKSNSEKQ